MRYNAHSILRLFNCIRVLNKIILFQHAKYKFQQDSLPLVGKFCTEEVWSAWLPDDGGLHKKKP